MANYLRGGTPVHMNYSTGVGLVQQWVIPQDRANHLWFKNTGTGAIVLSFSEADSTADRGITIAAGDVWEGPAEIAEFFTKSAAAESFEAVAFRRRG